MRASILTACVFLALMALVTGCRTMGSTANRDMAVVEITGKSEVDIYEAALAVFKEAGYRKKPGLVFERQGSSMDTVKYGGWSKGDVWVRVRIEIKPLRPNVIRLAADVYLVVDIDDKTMEEERNAPVSKRKECRKLLEQVKVQLEGRPPRRQEVERVQNRTAGVLKTTRSRFRL